MIELKDFFLSLKTACPHLAEVILLNAIEVIEEIEIAMIEPQIVEVILENLLRDMKDLTETWTKTAVMKEVMIGMYYTLIRLNKYSFAVVKYYLHLTPVF